jgi:hypothetical protein
MDDTMDSAAGCASTLHGQRGESVVLDKMGCVGALCDQDKGMMLEFSRVCVRRLGRHLPLKFFLSLFQHVLDANVLKEIEKDRLIIEHAATGFERGMDRGAVDVDGLFERTRGIDDEFIRKLSTPILSIEVRYEDFAEIRKKRIVSFVGMAFDVMGKWQDVLSFADNVKNTYEEKNYREFLLEVLHLYNIETRMLSHSFTFSGPAGKVKDLFAKKLFTTMEKTAEDIAAGYTRKVYDDKGRPFVTPG